MNEDYTYPVSEIIKTCNKYNSKILILCTPNNPTGNLLPTRQIEEIAQNVKCPILIDEAYGEFSNETMIPLIEKYPHMVVFRTFSKAYGLAGLRVGYGIGDREIIDAIYLTKPPYNLNVLSQKIATWVLQDEKVNRERIDYLKTEREYLIKELRKIPNIKVFDSDANFILIETQNSELANQLEKKEIFVRSFGVCEGTLLLRITVGTKEQNEKLLKVLKSIII